MVLAKTCSTSLGMVSGYIVWEYNNIFLLFDKICHILIFTQNELFFTKDTNFFALLYKDGFLIKRGMELF